MSAKSSLTGFSERLLAWHKLHGRHDLPWQKPAGDPYRVWVSEIMLQQTQVATVIPYFQKFMQRFPRIEDLASATESEVLALWSGLGYYARARNLLKCAQAVVYDHHAHFPETSSALAKLPGIGPSTAAAIASTVYGERAAILDGNVKRVLARLVCATEPWGSLQLHDRLMPVADALLPVDPNLMPAYTQAIMDLGATVCTARSPNCGVCPVKENCCAFQKNRVADFPAPKVLQTIKSQELFWVIPRTQKTVWLSQRPSRGIWGGLWTPWQLDLKNMPQNWARLRALLTEEHRISHRLTHRDLRISVAVMDLDARTPSEIKKLISGLPVTLREFSWQEAFNQALPSPVKKLLLTLYPFGKARGV